MLESNPKKLKPRSRVCLFVGYPKETRDGYFYDSRENKVFVLKNATFLEEDHIRDHKPHNKIVLDEFSDEATDTSTRVVNIASTLLMLVC